MCVHPTCVLQQEDLTKEHANGPSSLPCGESSQADKGLYVHKWRRKVYWSIYTYEITN